MYTTGWQPYASSCTWSQVNPSRSMSLSSGHEEQYGYGPFNVKIEPASTNAGRKRASRAGTRSVTALSPTQLARKRAKDREAQRAIRLRTKERIDSLEKKIEELRAARNTTEELLAASKQYNKRLEEENLRLRSKLNVQETGIAPTKDRAKSESDLSHLTQCDTVVECPRSASAPRHEQDMMMNDQKPQMTTEAEMRDDSPNSMHVGSWRSYDSPYAILPPQVQAQDLADSGTPRDASHVTTPMPHSEPQHGDLNTDRRRPGGSEPFLQTPQRPHLSMATCVTTHTPSHNPYHEVTQFAQRQAHQMATAPNPPGYASLPTTSSVAFQHSPSHSTPRQYIGYESFSSDHAAFGSSMQHVQAPSYATGPVYYPTIANHHYSQQVQQPAQSRGESNDYNYLLIAA